ncbi:hypothetical protein PTKIN_Ptkin10aG0085100 [Pterospermum kingtungense]
MKLKTHGSGHVQQPKQTQSNPNNAQTKGSQISTQRLKVGKWTPTSTSTFYRFRVPNRRTERSSQAEQSLESQVGVLSAAAFSMAYLFNKFQDAVRILAKSPTFAKYRRRLQFEDDINRLFMYTSYNRLGDNADECDAEEIIDMASKASLADQHKQVQENIHYQIKNFCTAMDQILLPAVNESLEPQSNANPSPSDLRSAVGRNSQTTDRPAIPKTRPLKRTELSQRLKDSIGYTLDVKPSQTPHNEAGQGLFLNGKANVGAVIAMYPGVIYSPAYYQYIPGYHGVDAQNAYLITRYDGTVINSQPWGYGGETRELWDGSIMQDLRPNAELEEGSDRSWKMLGKPLENSRVGSGSEILERRNPLAFAHFANHPAKEMVPNVMVCPYDFPLSEKNVRVYIPNISFGNAEVNMRRIGSSWFTRNSGSEVPVLKTLVLVATTALCDEEVLLN